MFKSNYPLLLVLLLALPNHKLTAQSDYSQESFVVESNATDITFENDGTGTRRLKARIRIQSDAGVQHFAVVTFAYQSSTETLQIDSVRVVKPDGSVVTTPPDNGQDLAAPITQQAPMFSDLREKHVAVKGLGTGDVLEYDAHWAVTKPLAPGQFWRGFSFSKDGIVLRQTFQVSVPRDRPVKWRSLNSQPVITEAGARKVFTWTGSHLQVPTEADEKKEDETALYQMQHGRLPQAEVELSSFQSWDDVGRWYGDLQKDRVKVTPEVRAKAADLTKGMTDDGAKARAIYRYVSSQIHYVGIDFGIGAYQPHFAAEVMANQYGDCKDKHTLLAALLAAAGIQSSPALINSARDVDPDVPSPGQFDHVITAILIAQQLTWVDATPDVARFAFLMSPMRGKKALVVSSDRAPSLVDTPAEGPVQAFQSILVDAKLSDSGTLTGTVERAVQGDDTELLSRTIFRSVPMPRWKDLAKGIASTVGISGDVTDVNVSSPENTDEPFRVSHKFEQKDYPGWSNRSVSAPLPLLIAAVGEKDERPSHPFSLGPPCEYRAESYVELPKGYKPSLPKSFDLNEPYADYHSSSRLKDGIWITKRRLVVRTEVPVSQFEEYRKFAKAVAEDYGRKVSFRSGLQTPDMYVSEIWELPGTESPDAIRYYDDARERVLKRDAMGAIDALKRTLAADPKFTRARLWIGELYKERRQFDEALAAFRKAVELDSQQPVSFKALGFTLLGLRKAEDAIPAFRQLIQIAPTDLAGPIGLAESMVALKRYPEAQSAFENAAQIDPDSPRVQMRLGWLYQHNGRLEDSRAAYRKCLELDPRPEMYNEVAYAMAEANQDLPVALEYARKAARESGLETHEIKLTQLRSEDLQTARMLSAVWDTLGWVYFRLGYLDSAEKYLSMAWTLSQSPVTGDHLAQSYEARNKKDAAIHMYRFALSRAPSSIYKVLRVQIQERLERLAPGTSTPSSREEMDVASEVSKLRTIALPRLAPGDSNAEFMLLFKQDPKTSKVILDEIKFLNGPEALKSSYDALKTIDFKISLPPDGEPHLLRRAILVCAPLTGCSITLLYPEDVNSAD